MQDFSGSIQTTHAATIATTAAAAGVSLATVDRVLNRRAGVSARTRDKVEGAVAALGFRNLANYIAYAEFRISDGMSTSGLC